MSRDRAFAECRRAYYFHYYGSWEGWKPAAPASVRELYVLKNLGNRFTFAGRVVHETIADVLNRHRYGREIGLEEAKQAALDSLRRGFRESREGLYRNDPKRNVGLFEHEYAVDLPDEDWVRMRDRVDRCLDNFYASEIRSVILETRVENWLPIDALDTFTFEGTKVYVAPDFALKTPQGNAIVIDWKTGRPGTEEDRKQIVCYGLFARDKWEVDPKRAIGELHYLQTGESRVVTLDEAALKEGVSHMRESIRSMKELLTDPALNRAEPERFPLTEDRTVCETCRFRRVCWSDWPPHDSVRER